MDTLGLWNATKLLAQLETKDLWLHSFAASFCNVTINGSLIKVFIIFNIFWLIYDFSTKRHQILLKGQKKSWVAALWKWCSWNEAKRECITASLRIPLHPDDSHRAKGAQEAGHRVELCCSKISKPSNYLGETVEKILYLRPGYSHWAKGVQEAGHGGEIVCSKILMDLKLLGGKS